MHISEIGLCGGHSASGVWVDEHARTTVPGLYAAGDLACVPHNYMIGAFVFGDLAGAHAAGTCADERLPLPADQIADAHELIYRPLRNPDGPPQPQVEYKLRRFVNDYVAPPKTGAASWSSRSSPSSGCGRDRRDGRPDPARADALRRGQLHPRLRRDGRPRLAGPHREPLGPLPRARRPPARDDDAWFFHLNLRRRGDGATEFVRRPVNDYLVPLEDLQIPEGAPQDVAVIAVSEPRHRSTGRPVEEGRVAEADETRSPRILELLELTEAGADLDALAGFLADEDARVRRAAVASVTELVPDGTGPALAAALSDEDADVRRAAGRRCASWSRCCRPPRSCRRRWSPRSTPATRSPGQRSSTCSGR